MWKGLGGYAERSKAYLNHHVGKKAVQWLRLRFQEFSWYVPFQKRTHQTYAS